MDFILDPIEEPPRDYIVKHDEDLTIGAIAETVFLSDTFSVGPPFTVRIIRGKHQTFQADTFPANLGGLGLA